MGSGAPPQPVQCSGGGRGGEQGAPPPAAPPPLHQGSSHVTTGDGKHDVSMWHFLLRSIGGLLGLSNYTTTMISPMGNGTIMVSILFQSSVAVLLPAILRYLSQLLILVLVLRYLHTCPISLRAALNHVLLFSSTATLNSLRGLELTSPNSTIVSTHVRVVSCVLGTHLSILSIPN